MKYQPNIPADLFNRFIENLGYMPEEKSVLVVRDLYTACYLAINNKVTFVSDDQEAIEYFTKTVIYNSEFGSDDTYIFVREETKVEWLNTINWITKNMKFDVAIMNPPYDKNLHLKILEKVIPIADKVINISPIRWLQDPLAIYKKTTDYKRFQNTISTKIKSLDIIPGGVATDIFKACITMDMGIYTCDSEGGFLYQNVGKNEILDKILTKLVGTKVKPYNGNTGYFVPVTLIDGGHKERSQEKSTYNFCRDVKHYGEYFINGISTNGKTLEQCKNDNKHCTNGNVNTWPIVECPNLESIKNYVASTKTKFFKYLYKVEMVDVHVHPEFLPWMEDYSQPWTDKRFCEYFDITGYIDDEHAEPNSEWEIILKTME